jgi:hypothetical protein
MDSANVDKDYCCYAYSDAGDDTASPVEPVAFTCALWSHLTTDSKDATIKMAKANTDRYMYDAWMWNAGVAAAATPDAKSASMISMALTTIVTIAVAAY